MTNHNHPNKTIKQRVMDMLRDSQWHSQNEFLAQFMPTARNRISETNEESERNGYDWVIASEKIENSNVFRYKLAYKDLCEKVKNGGGYSWKLINK